MNRNAKHALAALALLGTFGVGAAQARDAQVQWSITIGTPVLGHAVPVVALPVPVYARPTPVYVQPVPRFRPRAYGQPTRRDRDGDGIPNRYDRLYNPHWDRDGDGIPNRRDRYDDRRHDRHGEAVAYRRDRDGGPRRGR